MIVQPDFLEHFKTKALVELTGDEAAPLAVLRLWGHCQTSRRWQFPNMTPAQLAALCAWGNRKPACHTALLKAGFLKRLAGGGFEAHQWDQQNGKLIANWKNGPRGGRPKKGSKKGEQNGGGEGENNNPPETQSKPTANPPETDKRREDKRRSDDPRSNSGGTGVSVKGGRELSAGECPADDGALLTVPQFAPLPEGMFQRELEPLLKAARRERDRVERCEAACVWREEERPNYADDVAWHEAELKREDLTEARRAKLEREFAAVKASRMVRVRGPLKAQAVAVIRAWSARIDELEKAINGVRR